MKKILRIALLPTLFLALPASGQESKTRILLVGKDRDHPYQTHEYLSACELLAKCLRQTPGVEAAVSNGWPKDPEALRDVKALVLYTGMGGDVLFKGPNRQAAIDLLGKGAGLASIHWSTGASEGEPGELQLKHLGGWFGFKFSKFLVKETELRRADPEHPVSRGWADFKLRDEYYTHLRFLPEAKPAMRATIDGEDHVVGWTLERPGGGRSFGTVIGHFHANFGVEPFRRSIVNGILWTAGLEVPKDGAPCAIEPQDLEVPPDPRKK